MIQIRIFSLNYVCGVSYDTWDGVYTDWQQATWRRLVLSYRYCGKRLLENRCKRDTIETQHIIVRTVR